MKYQSLIFGVLLFIWLLSASIHGLALAGVAVQEAVPAVFLLHLLAMLGFMGGLLNFIIRSKGKKPKNGFALIRERLALPMQVLLGLCFVYTIFNFLSFAANTEGGTPSQESDGRYILHNRGELIRELSEAEYLGLRANELRGFSGHWLLFIGFACASFYPGNPKSSES